jgi:hypothetical protein
MFQFKSSNALKETLKFGNPKMESSRKAPSTLSQSMATEGTSIGRLTEGSKPPSTYWKKGTTSAFPCRPETTYTTSSVGKNSNSFT